MEIRKVEAAEVVAREDRDEKNPLARKCIAEYDDEMEHALLR